MGYLTLHNYTPDFTARLTLHGYTLNTPITNSLMVVRAGRNGAGYGVWQFGG